MSDFVHNARVVTSWGRHAEWSCNCGAGGTSQNGRQAAQRLALDHMKRLNPPTFR